MEPSSLSILVFIITHVVVLIGGVFIGAMIVKGDPDPFGEDAHPGPK